MSGQPNRKQAMQLLIGGMETCLITVCAQCIFRYTEGMCYNTEVVKKNAFEYLVSQCHVAPEELFEYLL